MEGDKQRLFAPYWLILTVAGKPQTYSDMQWQGFPLMHPQRIESVINSGAQS